MAPHDKNLPQGWALTTVARVGVVRVGRQLSPGKHTGRFSTKYLRAANITAAGLNLSDVLEMDFTPEERRAFGLHVGDVVLAEASGSASQVGRAAIWRGEIHDCCYQNTVIRFRPHAIHSEYALIVFRHMAVSGTFERAARGVGIQHLGGSRFSQLPVPLPPLNEQRRIATEFEKRLTGLQTANESLQSALRLIAEQNTEILAAAVGGELVETEAALATREKRIFEGPTATAPSLRKDKQASLFDRAGPDASNAMDELRQRRLPIGWVWVRVDEAGEVRLGKQLSPQHARGPNLRKYLRVANVFENRIDVSDVKQMDFTKEEYDVYRLKSGDVLLNEGQSLELAGRPALYRGEVPGACFQNTLIRFRAADGIDPEYALLVFRHYLHAGEFRKISRRSTNIAHLGLQRFAAMPFPLAPLSEQRRIVAEANRRLDASLTQESAIRASASKLVDLERELLTAAVTGSLVPQENTDEPADSLLERLGLSSGDRATGLRSEIRNDMVTTVKRTRRSTPTDSAPNAALTQVLREAGHPLSLPELFSRAGYNRDSTEHVEQFYLVLRAELGRSIRKVGDAHENALLEAITDAPR